MPVTRGPAMPTSVFDDDVLPNLLHSREPVELVNFYKVFLQHAEPISKQIQEKIPSDDFEALAERAHAIKSSSRSIGAIRLAELLCRLEDSAHAGNRENTTALLHKLGQVSDQTFKAIRQHVNELSIR